jgi:two-component system chemotaxis response regulator CheY
MAGSILIVDDSSSMRQLVSFTLKDAGYAVVEAADGKDALAKAAGAKIDMVITDLNMPEMDGLELIRRLKDIAAFKFTPIVMLTTESQESKKQEGKKVGASGWIVKPFTPEQLVKIVKKFLRS